MARNGSGVYTLPEPAFVPNTPISSAAVNNDLSDIAGALTGSIAADGQTTITAALKLDNSGVVYASDPNTGVRRTGADTQVIFAGGVDTLTVTATGSSVAGTFDATKVTQGGASILPAGFVGFTASASPPAGWLSRNGAAVSRTTYADLFAAIGTTYGAGDGSTTFNVPDARGRTDSGYDAGTGRLPGFGLGTAGGAFANTISQPQLPAVNLVTNVIDPGHGHALNIAPQLQVLDRGNGGAATFNGGVNATPFLSAANINVAGNTTGITAFTVLGGSNVPFNVVQPTMGLTPIIKT